jgi:hypothetical protein
VCLVGVAGVEGEAGERRGETRRARRDARATAAEGTLQAHDALERLRAIAARRGDLTMQPSLAPAEVAGDAAHGRAAIDHEAACNAQRGRVAVDA